MSIKTPPRPSKVHATPTKTRGKPPTQHKNPKQQKRSFTFRILLGLLWCGLAGLCLSVMLVCASVLYLSPKLPSVESLKNIQLQTPLRIYSADKKLIASFGEKRRKPLSYEQIPPQFVQAILAAEDHRFFEHSGVDFNGLARAVSQLIATGSKQSGGSTITMQVARNFFLNRKQTYLRKFNEILIALQIERVLSKEDILTLYLNKIYLGHRSYGIGAAASVYYGREISELSLAELAMIAGLPKAPSKYNPFTNPKRAKVRRNWILSRMASLNSISQTQLAEAQNSPVTASRHRDQQTELWAPYVAEMVRQQLLEQFGESIYDAGYKVYTTIDSHLQLLAEKAVIDGLSSYDLRHGYRGREGKLSGADLDLLTATTFDPNSEATLSLTQKILSDYYEVGKLVPGLVLQSLPEFAVIGLKDGSLGKITLQDMAWARKYKSANRLGPQLQGTNDALKVGDIIRVEILETSGDDSRFLPRLGLRQIPKAQSALVSIDPEDGKLLALRGGIDYRISKFNRATQGGRQVGSSIKPFIYAAALDNGYTAASLFNDAPLVFEDNKLETSWRPQNSGGRFLGPTRLRKALYQSRNLVSIRLLQELGVNKAISFLERVGFDKSKLPKDLSLALGSASLTPYELAGAYTVLANGGFKVTPYFISRIENATGELVSQHKPEKICTDCNRKSLKDFPTAFDDDSFEQGEARARQAIASAFETSKSSTTEDQFNYAETSIAPRVIDKRLWYITQSMMKDVIKYGTGKKALALKREDLAGKTGTTNDQKDAWFSGFSPKMVTIVWSGFDDPSTLGNREFGGTVSLPIWMQYMEGALAGTENHIPPMPSEIVAVNINKDTGKRAFPGQIGSIVEYFRIENAPEALPENAPYSAETPEDTGLEDIF